MFGMFLSALISAVATCILMSFIIPPQLHKNDTAYHIGDTVVIKKEDEYKIEKISEIIFDKNGVHYATNDSTYNIVIGEYDTDCYYSGIIERKF